MKATLRVLALGALASAVAISQADPQALLEQGTQAYAERDLPRALELWTEGLEVAKKQQADLFIGSFHGNLGIAYSVSGDYERAASHFEESLRLAREQGDNQGLKNRLNNVGALYLLTGKVDKALERFEEALEIARAMGDARLEAVALQNIGQAQARLDRPHAALESLRAALDLALQAKDLRQEAKALSGMGEAYAVMGHHAQALNHFRRALELAGQLQQSQATPLQIQTLNQMGRLARDLGDPLGAIPLHQSALQLAQAAGLERQRRESEALRAAATSEAEQGPEALERFRRQGLERMRERLERHGLAELAATIDDQLAKFDDTKP